MEVIKFSKSSMETALVQKISLTVGKEQINFLGQTFYIISKVMSPEQIVLL